MGMLGVSIVSPVIRRGYKNRSVARRDGAGLGRFFGIGIEKPFLKIRLTVEDRERETALVRREKRVAAMIDRAGSWEKLQQIWRITFPDFKPLVKNMLCSLTKRASEQGGRASRKTSEVPDGAEFIRNTPTEKYFINFRQPFCPKPSIQ